MGNSYLGVGMRKDFETVGREFDNFLKKITPCYSVITTTQKEMNKLICEDVSWCFAKFVFYSNPPIPKAHLTNRVLLIGTNIELEDFGKYMTRVGFVDSAQKQTKNIWIKNVNHTILSAVQRIFDQLKSLKVKELYFDSCSGIGSFWEMFFALDKPLDNIKMISIPCAIVTTGSMRRHGTYGGEIIDTERRLKEIAAMWQIPCYFLPSID